MAKNEKEAIYLSKKNGLDCQGGDEYPNKLWVDSLEELVNEGRIDVDNINESCRRVLTLKFKLGLFENPYTDENEYKNVINKQEHLDKALEIAQKSIILLKNNGISEKDIPDYSIAGCQEPLIMGKDNANTTNNISQNIIHINSGEPCIKRTIATIEKMWEYDPKSVPQKYWDIALEYLNEPILATTYGICQDVAFACHTGQTRRDCDPCAIPSAREIAKNQQIADKIKQNCTDK